MPLSGVDIFYLMLVTTIVGFVTVFQVRANAPELQERRLRVCDLPRASRLPGADRGRRTAPGSTERGGCRQVQP